MTTRALVLLALVLVLVPSLLGAAPAGPAEAAGGPWARASAPDGTLRAGCHDYPYRYRVKHAGNDWMLELVVRDRRGRAVASTALFANDDPRHGTETLRLCRAATRAGRFRFTGTLTVRSGYEQTTYRARPTTFRLERA